ncbi:ArsA family ATPase [Bacillus gobiensis]|uniref:ArsA family ATPase n=1 Tax=Bacillus gobiensis TaxID=1441095 RepID=UPI003D1DD183
MRIIIYTGKGGVGKTSIAAATGARLASEGLRTLVMSTDAAHNLTDAFQVPLGPDPTPISEYLWGQEVDNLLETERNWGVVQAWFGRVIEWSDLKDINKEEMINFPGMEELFSLLKILEHVESGKYDVLIVDCAPTGETLRLLSYPNVLTWWLEKIFPHQRRLVKLARPVARIVTGGLELPDNKVMDNIEGLFRRVIEVQSLLLDHSITSVRIVLNPEKMVISEARRSFTYLNLYGFNTDAIIVNRVLPVDADVGYLAEWKKRNIQYEEEITNNFQPIPILRIPLMSSEVSGLRALIDLAEVAFGERKLEEIFYVGKVEEVKQEQDGFILYLTLPFVSGKDLDVTQRGDELTIKVGAYRRKVTLPRSLTGRPILSARFVEERLRICFGERVSTSKDEEGIS